MKRILNNRIAVLLAVIVVLTSMSFVTVLPVNSIGVAEWAPGVDYLQGDLVTYGGSTYQCIQPHTSLNGWEPASTTSLWRIQEGGGVVTPTSIPPTPSASYTVSGYLVPGFTFSQSAASVLKQGFTVDIGGTGISCVSDPNGYFEAKGVPVSQSGYTLKISKPNYLTRYIENVVVQSDIQVATKDAPVDMWAGDMVRDGVQDGAINMTDIMEVVKRFNSAKGDGKYAEGSDLNKDNAINMTDIMIIIKNFNKTSANYPLIEVIKATPTPTPTPVETPTPTILPGEAMRPFPQNLSYAGCIKPSNVSQQSMNDSITSYYGYWKAKYVKPSNGTTPGGGYYVEMQGTGGSGNEITTSEAHGYGMMIFALMAGQDPEAKEYFDGMFNMYNNHRSTGDRDLMSWIIDRTELVSKDQGSATDGDMDIAYALLLAHHQWGSDGEIDYLAHAKRMITDGIKQSEMSLTSKRTMLGDWDRNAYSTRASDWMTGHFRAYQAATGDVFWNDAANTVYNIIGSITSNYSPTTGLMPDFVVENPPRPAQPYFLEAETDDDYSWNSCRFPWRIAMDYAHYGTQESKVACSKIIQWLKGATNNNPSNIVAGYKLDGTKLVNYSSTAFTSPFIAASITDSSNQEFLNAGWNRINNWKESYYGDSINLLCMVFISGNWWAPVN